MNIGSRLKHIWDEMICHLPFTIGGAAVGVLFMLLFKNMGQETGRVLFGIFHPAHVVLSAMVTSSLFLLHTKKRNFLVILVIGYLGAVGIATLSDCVIPFFGEEILGVRVPSHSALHEFEAEEGSLEHDHSHHGEHEHCDHGHEGHKEHEGHEHCDHGHPGGFHFGFIEEWYLVNPAALLGVLIAWHMPSSRYPHALHILISTWASSSHMLMNTAVDMSAVILFGMFIVLLVAVWVPCCVSDILFPLLFVKGDIDLSCRCVGAHNTRHSVGEEGEKGESEESAG